MRRNRLIGALPSEPEMKLLAEDGLARFREAMDERRQIDVGAPDHRDTWRTTHRGASNARGSLA